LQQLFQEVAGGSNITVINAQGDRYRDRIRAHVIPASLLQNVTGDNIKACLDFAISNAEDEIGKLRTTANDDYRKGQAHVFWVHQYANATLARKSFG
jgi:hypothetical protein